MKKSRFLAVSVMIVMLLMICTSSLSALEVAMVQDAEVEMNPMQLSVFKFSAHRKGMDACETAKAILRQVGYPENIIQALPEEKLLKVADSRRIESKEEYVCIQPNGEVISATREQFEADGLNSLAVSPLDTGESAPTTTGWAKLTTYIMQSNSNRTQYSYSATCVWLTTPFWRMNDYISIGVTEGSVDSNSVSAILSYTEVNHDTNTTTDRYMEKSGEGPIEIAGTTANCYFDLPNNSVISEQFGKLNGVEYKNFAMFIFINGEMTDASFSVPFNVGSAYFHQTFGITGDVTISVSTAGAGISFSIKPALCFNKITNSMKWTHKM